MFGLLGKIVSRGWPFVLAGWLIVAVWMGVEAPVLNDVTSDGPGFLLPDEFESRKGTDLLTEGFGEEQSRLIILVGTREETLTDEDKTAIRQVFESASDPGKYPLVGYVISPFTHAYLHKRLTSNDGRIMMCAIALKSQFVDQSTYRYIADVLKYLDSELIAKHPHLFYEITDSAAIGADYDHAAETSLDRTRFVTITLVLAILLVLYRSPVTWIVPIATIGLSLFIANCVMGLLCNWGVSIPKLVPIYLVVLIFGSGTDYCLFLIGRFREELARGHSRFDAARIAITHVGEAVTASAITTIAGLSMMALADFEIFRTTGPACGIGLAVALVAALTFAPSLMVILGKRIFWPRHLEVVDIADTKTGHLWTRFARLVVRRPGLVLVIGLCAFMPFTGWGNVITPSYDLFAEMPKDAPSARGNRLILERFDETSRAEQLTLVIKGDDHVNRLGEDDRKRFRSREGMRVIDAVTRAISASPEVVEVRSVTQPIGQPMPGLERYLKTPQEPADGKDRRNPIGLLSNPVEMIRRQMEKAWLNEALSRYVSPDGAITRINILLKSETFSPEAMAMPETLTPVVQQALDDDGAGGAEFHFAGISSHMRDIGIITRADLKRLRWYILGVLFVILAIVLRGVVAPVYLLATMVVNYFAALGITDLLFIRIPPLLGMKAASGLDWKVEFFLFVLLVAIGVDYNIYIMSRVREETGKRKYPDAIHRSIVSTGAIISSCGIIMAGTFGSMLASPLSVMKQIGVAMAIGVLLDTFIVRPLVVPSIALLVHRTRNRILRRTDDDPNTPAA